MIEMQPGDTIRAYQETDGGDLSILPRDSIEDTLEEVARLSAVPGAWWKRYPREEVQEEPTYGQSIVWTLKYPEGHVCTGILGYYVQWNRNTNKKKEER